MSVLKKVKNRTVKIILAIFVCILAVLTIYMVQQNSYQYEQISGKTYENPNQYTEDNGESEKPEWELSMLMYDSAVEKGNKALKEDVWNATLSEERVITVQVNYKNINVTKAYEPGELKLTIDNLGKLCPTYHNDRATKISADEKGSTQKKYDWSYEYNSSKQQYILTNNNKVEMKTNFEGTIQLAYSFDALWLLNDSFG